MLIFKHEYNNLHSQFTQFFSYYVRWFVHLILNYSREKIAPKRAVPAYVQSSRTRTVYTPQSLFNRNGSERSKR